MELDKFKDSRILVIGDLMIDAYVWGTVDRISPEAPVQIVSVDREDFTLGGAGNVVNNLAALGATVRVAGVIGAGPDGRLLMERFGALGVDTAGIAIQSDRPTTRKTRIIASNQHVLRIDRETRQDISPETQDQLITFIQSALPQVDVVLVSDYGKGVISPSLMAVIVAEARDKPVVVDPKGLDYKRYKGASLITPNRKEAGLAAGIEIREIADLDRAAQRIMDVAGIDRLLITCGKDGMVFYQRGAPPHRIAAETRQVFDVSGAGDTVLAVLGLALAAKMDVTEAAALANIAAGIVVGKVGTATVSIEELSTALAPRNDETTRKLTQMTDLAALATRLRRQGKRIVLTNGCFDLIHAGHLNLFSRSRQYGDVLIVAIDDDDSVRRVKGAGRPVIGQKERLRTLCALESIDFVVVFASEALKTLIDAIRPDVLTKGSNYADAEVACRDAVERHGGRVALIPVTEDLSTTEIINSIKKR
ncbi:MAG: D-glycero-beta-D-manno-heptose-7-phosphate kinase [Desulfobacterales bacterium]|nr:D-glycero-beta-D-manno-heptose-7-phosphate kinase [Desulfobacterales bacterium]